MTAENETIEKIRKRIGEVASMLSYVRAEIWYYERYMRIITTEQVRAIAKVQRYDREEKRLMTRLRRLNLWISYLAASH